MKTNKKQQKLKERNKQKAKIPQIKNKRANKQSSQNKNA